jgi:hypothetical protein
MGTYSSKDVVGGADGSLDIGIGAGAGGGIPTRQHSAQQQQSYYGRPGGSTPRSGAGVPIGPSAGMGMSAFDSSSAGGAPTVVLPGTSISKQQRMGGDASASGSSMQMGAESAHALATNLQAVGDETNDTGMCSHAVTLFCDLRRLIIYFFFDAICHHRPLSYGVLGQFRRCFGGSTGAAMYMSQAHSTIGKSRYECMNGILDRHIFYSHLVITPPYLISSCCSVTHASERK